MKSGKRSNSGCMLKLFIYNHIRGRQSNRLSNSNLAGPDFFVDEQ